MKRQHPDNPDLFWCPKCGEYHPIIHFRGHQCRWCKAKYDTIYREQHAKKISERQKIYSSEHSDEAVVRMREWREKNQSRAKELNYKTRRSWAVRNKDKLRDLEKSYRAELREFYINRMLRSTGIDVTPETIDLKREQIILQRELKQLKGELQNGIA
jgi:hypothetical protein